MISLVKYITESRETNPLATDAAKEKWNLFQSGFSKKRVDMRGRKFSRPQKKKEINVAGLVRKKNPLASETAKNKWAAFQSGFGK